MSRLFAKGSDPDALRGAWIEDGMPVRQSTREIPRVERKPWDPEPCCAAGRVVYDCTCAYRTICAEHGERCHGTHD